VSWGLDVVHGPVSLHPQAGPQEFHRALSAAFAADGVDAIVAAFIPPIATEADEVARVLADVSAGHPIPVVACFLATSGMNTVSPPGSTTSIPSYPTPEEAVRALATAQRYAAWRRRDPGRRVELTNLDLRAARSIVADALAAAGSLGDADPPAPGAAGEPEPDASHELDADTTARLLAAFGVTRWPQTPVSDPQSAVSAAQALGFPVALKSTAEHLRHRTDLGGVRLNIDDADALLEDLAQMRSFFGPLDGDRFVVQRMAPPGVACLIRTVEDPLFGPVVSFGLAGDASELLGDVAHRIPPLTDVDIADLVRSVRAAPKLFGHHGATPVDVTALEDLLGRVACLADELPEVAELELNPVVVSTEGLAVLGAVIRLTPRVERSDTARRELPGS
jgi:acyl-CoA synthetase (NDP forming)